MTYLTDADVAERLQVDETTVVEWRRRYSWPHLKLGRQVRYTEANLRAIEDRHRVASTQPTALPGQTTRSAARAAS